MLIVDIWKYIHETDDYKRSLKKYKLQLFNPIVSCKKSLMGLGSITIDLNLNGDSYRTNELETNGQLYSFGTVWDTTSNKKFDFKIDRIDIDNNKSTCKISGFDLKAIFDQQIRLDFSKPKFCNEKKLTKENKEINLCHNPNLLEIWQEIKDELIDRDNLFKNYFWKEAVVFKDSEKEKVNVNQIIEEVKSETYKRLNSKEITDKVNEFGNFIGQNMIVNIWQFLKPLLFYCDFTLNAWLNNDGIIFLQLKDLKKNNQTNVLNEFVDILKIEDLNPKINIVEATIKFESVRQVDEWITTSALEYEKEKKKNEENVTKTKIVKVPAHYEITLLDNKPNNVNYDEHTIDVFPSHEIESSYEWEKFNFPNKEKNNILILKGFTVKYLKYIDSNEPVFETLKYDKHVLLKWVDEEKDLIYWKKTPISNVRPRVDGIPTIRYAINSENKIVRLDEGQKIHIKQPFSITYFEEKTLAEAQTKAVLTLVKNLYSYRVSYDVVENRLLNDYDIGTFLEVRFYGKSQKLPINEIEYKSFNGKLKEKIVLGSTIPDLNELMVNVSNKAEVKI